MSLLLLKCLLLKIGWQWVSVLLGIHPLKLWIIKKMLYLIGIRCGLVSVVQFLNHPNIGPLALKV